jgi:hypothetical protein
MNHNEKITNDSDNLLQFTTMLSIFFVSIFDYLFKLDAGATSETIGKVEITWVQTVGVLIICFLIFKIFKKYHTTEALRVFNILNYIEIFFFVIPIFILGKYFNTIDSTFAAGLLTSSLKVLFYLPLLMFGTILFGLVIRVIKTH